MRKAACFAMLVGLATVWISRLEAVESQPVAVTVGKMEVVDVAFDVQGYRVANQEVVKVESLAARKLRILGLKAGTSDVQVTGQGGLSIIFTITVQENVKAVYGALMKDLDSVPEVELSINLGRVMVKGEVSNIAHWELMQKVIVLYGDQVVNLATFHPTPEVLIGLKSALEKAGLTVLQDKDDASAPAPGAVKVTYSGNTIFINGQVYSAQDAEKIRQVIKSQSWITVASDKESADKDKTKIRAVVDIGLVPTMLELDVVFVGVTDEEASQIGVNLAKAGLLVVDTTAAVYKGTVGKLTGTGDTHGGFAGTYMINSGLQGALKFFAGSGPGRFRTAGHMTFKNDAPEWRTYHSGGTLKVRTVTAERMGLNDIDYGLIMKVKGGLQDSKTAAMDVALELSYPSPVGTDYDVKKNKIDTTVMCGLGQTMVMGGMKSLVEQTSREGVPFLRSIPIIHSSWARRRRPSRFRRRPWGSRTSPNCRRRGLRNRGERESVRSSSSNGLCCSRPHVGAGANVEYGTPDFKALNVLLSGAGLEEVRFFLGVTRRWHLSVLPALSLRKRGRLSNSGRPARPRSAGMPTMRLCCRTRKYRGIMRSSGGRTSGS
jgi:Flp pilus assembly secretin CpaC